MKPKRKIRTFVRRSIFVIALLIFTWWVLAIRVPVKSPKYWGVTFSYPYMEQFGIPWKEGYQAVLHDLGARHIRLPAYWSHVEPQEGEFVFDDLDYQIQEAEKVGAKIILVVGRKTPRWPECNDPSWLGVLSEKVQKDKLLVYMRAVVERYRSSRALEAWQVENEPFLAFGICPRLDTELLDKEIALVRELDSTRPIIVTDSGELSLWFQAAQRGDIFGTSLYRTIYKKQVGGYFTYPIPPSFFRVKRAVTELVVGPKPALVIELQAESWGPRLVYEMPKEEQYISMNPKKLKEIIAYSKQSGFDAFYLWGVEWWYWLKVHGDSAMWDTAKSLFK